MKKLLSCLSYFAVSALCLLTFSGFCVSVLAADADSAAVYVTLSYKGEIVAAREKVEVSDADGDGALTVNDALCLLHDEKYEGGSEAGYGYYSGDYGISMSKLWGDDSGAFGYYLNHESCMSLAERVTEGDTVTAFVYSDTEGYSDSYCFFDYDTGIVEQSGKDHGSAAGFTLYSLGYDESWNTVTLPVEGAVITIDGEATDIKTAEDGSFWIGCEETGTHIVSAEWEGRAIVPPVLILTVKEYPIDSESATESGDDRETTPETEGETACDTTLAEDTDEEGATEGEATENSPADGENDPSADGGALSDTASAETASGASADKGCGASLSAVGAMAMAVIACVPAALVKSKDQEW